MEPLVIDRADSALLLVDVQQKLASAMPRPVLDDALRHWLQLVEMAALLKLPVGVSEQYPKGLGPTVPALQEALAKVMPPTRFFEKVEFNCCEAAAFNQFLGHGRKTLIVCGMECHICVYQTVRGLTARGYRVHVPVDACASRKKLDWETGRDLMQRAGAVITTTETVLFDLVKKAGSDDFRALSRIVK